MIEALVVCYVRLVGSCGKSIEVGCDWEGVKEGVAKVYTRWLKEEAYVVPATCEYATGCASLSAVMPVADAYLRVENLRDYFERKLIEEQEAEEAAERREAEEAEFARWNADAIARLYELQESLS